MKIVYDRFKKNREGAVWIRRVLTAWLVAASFEYWILGTQLRDLSGLEGIAAMNAGRMAAIGAAVFALLWVLRNRLSEREQRRILAGAAGILMAGALTASFTWPLLIVCVLMLVCIAVYETRGWNGSALRGAVRCREQNGWGWATAAAAVLFFGFVSVWTVCRVRSFSVPTYDFGIFSQMFHSMKTTGLPITTVERDGPLSHFAVHVSPAYYLLLPFYALWPRPETLQILQAAVMASAVIPLWLLGKQLGFSGPGRTLLCALLLLQPAFGGGAGYDIHENCLLTPLLLWLFWAAGQKNTALTLLFPF